MSLNRNAMALAVGAALAAPGATRNQEPGGNGLGVLRQVLSGRDPLAR